MGKAARSVSCVRKPYFETVFYDFKVPLRTRPDTLIKTLILARFYHMFYKMSMPIKYLKNPRRFPGMGDDTTYWSWFGTVA